MATIGYINNGRTMRPTKEKGNPVTRETFTVIILRLEGQSKGQYLQVSLGPDHPGEAGATKDTQEKI